MDSLLEHAADVGSLAVLSRFRLEFRACLTARGDELFELADAVLCADGPVRTLAGQSLAPEHRRGHGALYDAVNCGRVGIGRLRRSLAGLPLPRAADGRLVLAVDVSNWLRPGAATSPGRLFCHVYGRGRGQAQMIPGWPYSVIAALEPGRTSWTAVLDAVRLGPDDDEAEVTAGQVRDVVARLITAGHWREGDPAILVILDAGYDVTRGAYLLADLPVELPGRLRSDRVLLLPAPQVTTSTRWTWLIIACHAQLRLARALADDLHRPWERPARPGRLTPTRVHRGFRNIRAKAAQPAGAPKPGKPGPGRPPGSKNRRPAPRHDVGKTTKRELTLKARREVLAAPVTRPPSAAGPSPVSAGCASPSGAETRATNQAAWARALSAAAMMSGCRAKSCHMPGQRL